MNRIEGEGPVLRLSSRDHFVDVVTPSDTHTIRMRLADAIAEMDGVAGYSTHRSHWVACDAIRDVTRDGAKVNLVLCNGDSVPVSRSYRSELQERGLI